MIMTSTISITGTGLFYIGERPYACDTCGMTFAFKHVLKVQKLVHLGERLYKYNLCAETYNSEKTFDEHIITRESISNQHHTCSEFVSSSTPTSSSSIILHEIQIVVTNNLGNERVGCSVESNNPSQN